MTGNPEADVPRARRGIGVDHHHALAVHPRGEQPAHGGVGGRRRRARSVPAPRRILLIHARGAHRAGDRVRGVCHAGVGVGDVERPAAPGAAAETDAETRVSSGLRVNLRFSSVFADGAVRLQPRPAAVRPALAALDALAAVRLGLLLAAAADERVALTARRGGFARLERRHRARGGDGAARVAVHGVRRARLGPRAVPLEQLAQVGVHVDTLPRARVVRQTPPLDQHLDVVA